MYNPGFCDNIHDTSSSRQITSFERHIITKFDNPLLVLVLLSLLLLLILYVTLDRTHTSETYVLVVAPGWGTVCTKERPWMVQRKYTAVSGILVHLIFAITTRFRRHTLIRVSKRTSLSSYHSSASAVSHSRDDSYRIYPGMGRVMMRFAIEIPAYGYTCISVM